MTRGGLSSYGALVMGLVCALLGAISDAGAIGGDAENTQVSSGSINTGVFGAIAFPIRNLPISSRWEQIYGAMEGCGDAAVCRSNDPVMHKLALDMRRKGLVDKLGTINRFVNHSIRYRSDRDLYGVIDYWATPEEILNHKAGDCEDIAIVKMFALVQAGIPPDVMAIVVVRDEAHGAYHAVLSVAAEGEIYILDNLRDDVLNDTAYKSYVPLYSLSAGHSWVYGFKHGAGPASVSGSLSKMETIAPGYGPYWSNAGRIRCCRALPYRW